MEVTAYWMAERWIGLKEFPKKRSNPFVLGMLQLDQSWPEDDEVPWCSAFVNFVCWQLRKVRSKSLRARSWLLCGTPVAKELAKIGWDVVILAATGQNQPGPEIIAAPGHVGFFAGYVEDHVYVLGGNQGNAVSVAPFPVASILGVRRVMQDG